MSLEEPKEANMEGLKEAFDNSVSKMKFTFKHHTKEVGRCSDSTNVNIALHRLVKAEIGVTLSVEVMPST